MGAGIIESILNIISRLWPFTRVAVWEQGVKETYYPWDIVIWENWRPTFKLRPPHVKLTDVGPGWHLRILFLHEIHTLSVVENVLELKSQHLTTMDDISLSYSVNVVYTVKDVRKAVTQVHDVEQSLKALIEVHVSRTVREKTWKEIQEGQAQIESDIKRLLQKGLKDWGCKAEEVGMVTMVKSKQYHLFQTLGTDSSM